MILRNQIHKFAIFLEKLKYKSALAGPKCALIVTNSVFVTPNSVFVLSALRLGENQAAPHKVRRRHTFCYLCSNS